MKKYIQISMLFMVMFGAALEAAPLMSLAEPAINPSPLDGVENNGEGTITFLMSERNDVNVSGSNRFKVTVVMSNVTLKDSDITAVKVEDGRDANADVTDKFDVTFLESDNMVIVQQKSTEELPGNMRYWVRIPVDVTGNTPVTNPNNGFLINMSAEDDAIADGDSSDYTYTIVTLTIDAVDDINSSVPGSGGVAIADVTSNDTLDGNPVILGTDVDITNVTDNTPYLEINDLTGEAIVPSNTPAGIYTEIYTLCEISTPSNCADTNVTVTVTAASINAIDDINNSVQSMGGIVILDVTDNDTLNNERVQLGTDVNITNVTDSTPYLDINSLTGEAIVPNNTPAGTYTEEYIICENLNPSNCTNATVTVIVMPDPDYRPILTVYGGIVNGVGIHAFSFDTLVRNIIEDSSYNPSRPLVITIPKNAALTLTFDSSTISFKGQEVENSLWSFDDSDPFDYIMTYIGSDIPTGRSRFSLEGTLEVEEGEVSKFFLETTIQSGTGGDSNIDNNSDRETLEKRL